VIPEATVFDWLITEVRGNTDGTYCNNPDCRIEVAEMAFYDETGAKIPFTQCTVTGTNVEAIGTHVITKIFDGDTGTSFLHENGHGSMTITFTFDAPVQVSAFAFVTAKAYQSRDPATWLMEVNGIAVESQTAWTTEVGRLALTEQFLLDYSSEEFTPAPALNDDDEAFSNMPQSQPYMCDTRYDPTNLPNYMNVATMSACEDGCMQDENCKGIEYWADTVNQPVTPFCFYCSQVEPTKYYGSTSDTVYPPIVKERGASTSDVNDPSVDTSSSCDPITPAMCSSRYGSGWEYPEISADDCFAKCQLDSACLASEYWSDETDSYSQGPACFFCSVVEPTVPYTNTNDAVYPPTIYRISC